LGGLGGNVVQDIYIPLSSTINKYKYHMNKALLIFGPAAHKL